MPGFRPKHKAPNSGFGGQTRPSRPKVLSPGITTCAPLQNEAGNGPCVFGSAFCTLAAGKSLQCNCSTAAYFTVTACEFCANRSTSSVPEFLQQNECGVKIESTFPSPLPSGELPPWLFAMVSATPLPTTFDAAAASSLALSKPISLSSTSLSPSTALPSVLNPPDTISRTHPLPRGAIVGIVFGIVVPLIVVFLLFFRRRRPRMPPNLALVSYPPANLMVEDRERNITVTPYPAHVRPESHDTLRQEWLPNKLRLAREGITHIWPFSSRDVTSSGVVDNNPMGHESMAPVPTASLRDESEVAISRLRGRNEMCEARVRRLEADISEARRGDAPPPEYNVDHVHDQQQRTDGGCGLI
ncbi:hypothetical protein FB45DRAFT_933557 [Roridomyces roridus]|uniref:Extracellular membrane protein CFEM domain-containing protein n=1 Tax=Roridomyces roridus TaxID=1738132 RepID=A0AAD7BCT7_9AGAR|nr:hypothetical protein FB45DRAFT_933557 [Roridomyces roridus]